MNKSDKIVRTDNENRLFPFLCVYGDEDEQTLIDAVEHIYNSGARGLCVESKRSPHYGKEHWWFTLDVILRECKKYGMKMWTVDEPFVPSGYANGAVKKHPELRKWHIVESHVDVIGPMGNAKVLENPTSEQDILLGVTAYRRANGETEDLTGEPIELTDNLHNGFLYWDVPDGIYRIFFIYVTQFYAGDYIDFFNRESVQLVLDEIYEPHYRHYKDEFGKTFAGFFSDEPGFWNPPFGNRTGGAYNFDNAVGVSGYAMPWGDNVWERMQHSLGRKNVGDLVALWYDTGKDCSKIRFSYMNAVTALFYEIFNKTVGDWCIKHGVVYNGHVVEDNGVNARLGMGAGHYFRAMQAYEFAGVDIVLHQVLPGFAHIRHASFADGGFANTDFYHYVLGQLASSDAHLNKKSGKALCEIFGAFGWGENVSMMKWLIDFMLVRGVTRFIPHSFTTHTHDVIFPPTFSAKNNDPQSEGVKKLFGYVQKAGAVIESGTHVVSVALLYTGFAEWIKPNSNKALESTARVLYDGHICYDILPEDVLQNAKVIDGKLVCKNAIYQALIVPNVLEYPEILSKRLQELQQDGATIVFIDSIPQGATSGKVVPKSELVKWLIESGIYDLKISGNELLRYYHCTNDSKNVYMFFNEYVDRTVDTNATLRHVGKYKRIDLLHREIYRGETTDGSLQLKLAPYSSVIYVFDDFSENDLKEYSYELKEEKVSFPDFKWDISVAPYNDIGNFIHYVSTAELFDISACDRKPCFSGAIKYVSQFDFDGNSKNIRLNMGDVGGVATVKVNGIDQGTAICSPYIFDISDAIKKGRNDLEIIVRTSLAGAMIKKENFCGLTRRLTAQIPLGFSGVKGSVSLVELNCEKNKR